MSPVVRLTVLSAALLVAGCDMLGIESAEVVAARKEADGKAVGSACRQAARALEDCFALNRRSDKAAIFAGWREMNDYMRENKIPDLLPTLAANAGSARPPQPAEAADAKAAADDAKHAAHDS